MLFEKLKADRIQAMKDKNDLVKNLLSTLIGEASKEVKEPEDASVIATIKKFIKNCNEMKFQAEKHFNREGALTAATEINILMGYLPQQLDEKGITALIANLVASDPNLKMADVMKFFKTNYEGQYDGKLVSEIAKKVC